MAIIMRLNTQLKNLMCLCAIVACIAGRSPCAAQSDGFDARASASVESVSDGFGAAAEPFRLDFGALQEVPASAPFEPAEDAWRVDFTAWMWLTAMSGEVRNGPITADVDASFSDILEASDSLFSIAGRLEIGKGNWTGFIDGMYSDIGAEDQTGPVGLPSVDVTNEILLLDFGLMYRVFDQSATNGGGRHNTIDVYAGGRYQHFSLELDPALAATRSQSKGWIDPIFGARAVIQLNERFDFMLMGDIGGFGVGSDLTWTLRAGLGYHFVMFDIPTTAYLGYAALGTDYTEGSGLSRFEWDVVMHGPVLGLTFSF
jgi:hypothetical protein